MTDDVLFPVDGAPLKFVLIAVPLIHRPVFDFFSLGAMSRKGEIEDDGSSGGQTDWARWAFYLAGAVQHGEVGLGVFELEADMAGGQEAKTLLTEGEPYFAAFGVDQVGRHQADVDRSFQQLKGRCCGSRGQQLDAGELDGREGGEAYGASAYEVNFGSAYAGLNQAMFFNRRVGKGFSQDVAGVLCKSDIAFDAA